MSGCPTRLVTAAGTAVLGLALAACTPVSGEARPQTSGRTSAPATSTAAPTSTSTVSIDDLDLCTLLAPEDLPVDPGPNGTTVHEYDPDFDGCVVGVQLANPLDLISVGVSRRDYPFDEFVAPDGPRGEFTGIGGREAWVGRATSDEAVCGAIFGAADGIVEVTIVDETRRGIDPCDTVAELAEIAIPRTPPPNEQ